VNQDNVSSFHDNPDSISLQIRLTILTNAGDSEMWGQAV
jgi:hypothetical protein